MKQLAGNYFESILFSLCTVFFENYKLATSQSQYHLFYKRLPLAAKSSVTMPCSNDLFTAALIVAALHVIQKHLQTSLLIL
jgi:hypothetical protein